MSNNTLEILEDEFTEDHEFIDDQCPACLEVFNSDEELLAHICNEQ